MKLIWLTDLHLNFTCRETVDELCYAIRLQEANAILITGDIATSQHLCSHLELLEEQFVVPIFFILGNHDYYHSSIQNVTAQVKQFVAGKRDLVWLSQAGVVHLSSNTCLIGHDVSCQ